MAKNLPDQDPCLPGVPPISPSDMAKSKLAEHQGDKDLFSANYSLLYVW